MKGWGWEWESCKLKSKYEHEIQLLGYPCTLRVGPMAFQGLRQGSIMTTHWWINQSLKSTQSTCLRAPTAFSSSADCLHHSWISSWTLFLNSSIKSGGTEPVCFAIFCWTPTQSFPGSCSQVAYERVRVMINPWTFLQGTGPLPTQISAQEPPSSHFTWRETFCPDKSAHVLYSVCSLENYMTQSHDHLLVSQLLFLNSELVWADRTENLFWSCPVGTRQS